MRDAPDTPSVEALLAQAGWVRALARGLVADPAQADDVEQDTWLAALQRPPRATGGSALRAWLARVARNAAGQRGRSEGARARRERAAGRGEAQPDPAQVVEQAWTHRRLVDAVLRLREPERSTVLLRYFQGRSAEEIARKSGVPASTVRDRLGRALDELRAELRRELGGEEAWLRALAPLAAGDAASLARPLGAGGSSIVGVMAMGNAVKVAGAAALAVALGALVFFEVRDRGGASEGTGLASAGDAGAPPEAPAAGPEDAASHALSGAADPGRRTVASAEAWALAGAVTSLDGAQPLDEVAVCARPAGGDEVERARTDALGGFALSEEPDLSTSLVFRKEGYEPRTVPPEEIPRGDAARIDVVLAPHGVLDVEVVDAGGLPVPELGIFVQAADRASWRNLAFIFRSGVTDARGRCAVADIPTGVGLEVFARHGDLSFARIDPASRRASVRLVHRPAGRVIGRVLGAGGAPAAGASVLLARRSDGSRTTRSATDPEGRFAFEQVEPGPILVRADLTDLEVEGELAPGGELDLGDLRLPELTTVEGRLVSSFRFDPQSFEIEAYRDGRLLGEPVWPDREGRFTVRVAPGALWLRVSEHVTMRVAEGTGEGVVWRRESLHEVGDVLRREVAAPASGLELSLDAGAGALHGGIRGLAGGDRTVALHVHRGDVAPEEFARHRWILVHQELGVAVRDGRFESLALRAGRYHVAVDVEGAGRVWLRDVDVAPGVATDLGWLEPSGGALEGVVRTAGGEALASAVVSLDVPWSSDAHRAVAGADGRFRLDGLPPGAFAVRASFPAIGESAERFVEVPPGSTCTVELVVSAGGRIAGRVLRAGKPAAGEAVTVGRPRHGSTELAAASTSDADGRFAFEGLTAGDYQVYAGAAGHRGELVALAPGGVAQLEFELAGDCVEILPLQGGAPLTEVDVARLVELDPAPGSFHAVATGERLEEGWLRFPALDGTCLLLLSLPGADGDLPVRVSGLEPGARIVVDLPEGVLELATEPEVVQGPAPRLSLTSLDGLEVPLRVELPRQVGLDGRWSFRGVPRGARLRLEGPVVTGWSGEREVIATGEPVQAVPWP